MRRSLQKLFLVFLLSIGLGYATPGSADPLPSDSKIDWSYTGVPGGIPPRPTLCATLSAGATASQIQKALDDCPANQTVFLKAGSYALSSGLRISNDNVTLRGAVDAAGAPATILNFAASAGGWGLIDISKAGYPANNWNSLPSRKITSPIGRGTTSITLASAPTGLMPGQMFAIDQLDDEDLVRNETTAEGGGTWSGRNGNRGLSQFIRVTTMNGATVNFEPPLFSTYWRASQQPEIYWFGSGTSEIVTRSGIENLKINRTIGGDGAHNIAIGPADSCWVKNIRSTQCDLAHVRTGWTLNTEIRDSYFTLHDNVGSATYSIYHTYSSSARIENNIMYDTPCALGMMDAVGNAIAYNYGTKFPYRQANWLPETMMLHGGHCNHNLFEGNFIPSFWIDLIHGNSSYDTYFRNRVTGWEQGKTGSTTPINIEAQQDHIAVIGNALGTTGYHTGYEDGLAIWNVDPDARATLVRKANWNSVNASIPNNEQLNGDTLPNSYIYHSKPSWFGDRPWPAVNPFVGAASTPENLPAGYRFQTGALPPGAGQLAPSAPLHLRQAP